MLTVVYDAVNGEAIPDGKCAAKAQELAANLDADAEFITSSEVMLTAIRVLIKQGQIPLDKVQVYFRNAGAHFEEQIMFNKDARAMHWPNGFCDTYQDFLMELF